MDIILSHNSAFFCWRRFAGQRSDLSRTRRTSAMDTPLRLTPELHDELATLGLAPEPKRRLHVLVASANLRSAHSLVRTHVCSAELPSGSLVRVSPHVLITSPELTFLQLAKSAPETKLIMAGCELCGTYALDADLPAGETRVLPARSALTSVGNLAAFAADAPGLPGRDRAIRALRYVFENAASPMEAKLALLLTLPPRLGGRHLPRPVLNHAIPLTDTAKVLYDCNECRADLYWPDAMLDVEYDGGYHEDERVHAKGLARAAALEAQGVDVLTVAYPQVADAAAFTLIAEGLAARLGKSSRNPREDFVLLETKLRADLQV